MAEPKQILVVDDHFDTLDLLRTMFELSGREYDVIGVPSGEEGWLELRRRDLALMITDMNLPGMTGFELIRRARQLQPDLPIIIITGYGSEEGRDEAANLGVLRYFEKPIAETDDLLAAAQTAMGEAVTAAGGGAVGSLAINDTLANVGERLEKLRHETGSLQILLIDGDGNILFEEGQDCGLDLGRLATTLSLNMSNSSFIADHLGGDDPSTIQYYAGAAVDLYVANIGTDYFVMVLFEGLSRRGRIGTVWVFLQRAANDLLNLIQQAKNASQTATGSPTTASLGSLPVNESDAARDVPTGPLDDKFVPTAPLDPSVLTDTGELLDEVSDVEAPELELSSLDEFPLDENAFDFDLDEALASEGDESSDDFWNDALTKNETGPLGKGFTLEQAREQGLFPTDLDESEES